MVYFLGVQKCTFFKDPDDHEQNGSAEKKNKFLFSKLRFLISKNICKKSAFL